MSADDERMEWKRPRKKKVKNTTPKPKSDQSVKNKQRGGFLFDQDGNPRVYPDKPQ